MTTTGPADMLPCSAPIWQMMFYLFRPAKAPCNIHKAKGDWIDGLGWEEKQSGPTWREKPCGSRVSVVAKGTLELPGQAESVICQSRQTIRRWSILGHCPRV